MENTKPGHFRMFLNCIFFIKISNKQQAWKQQATSQEATSHKIPVDSYSIIRYSRINMIRLLIGQCAQAWNLQLSPPLKSQGMGGNLELQAKPFSQKLSNQPQATSYRDKSCKHQATSSKHYLI